MLTDEQLAVRARTGGYVSHIAGAAAANRGAITRIRVPAAKRLVLN